MTTATSTEREITLESLRAGAADELFIEQLDRAVENIRDERTGGGARSVTLTVVLQPFLEKVKGEPPIVHRDRVFVDVQANAKLAPICAGAEEHGIRRVGSKYQLALGL